VPPDVDLVVNCYERTYRQVLAPGFMAGLAADQAFAFAGRVVLVNNVDDLEAARRLARERVAEGELTAFGVVAEELPAALAATGLALDDLGRVRHFSDCALVAVTRRGAPWLAYWDAGVGLERRCDWISPAIALMEADPRVLVANPGWGDAEGLARETLELRDGFALGVGMSDQAFLARRADLARPIYGERCIARLRNPLAHLGDIFESWLDSHMRHHGRLRATHRGLSYHHPPADAGASYPASGPVERLRLARNMAALAALRAAPPLLRPRCARAL
jgi:hypothetical protein